MSTRTQQAMSGQPAIRAGDGELVEHPWRAQVKLHVPGTDRGVRERTGEVCLADTGQGHDENRLVLARPVALGEVQHRLPFEPTLSAIVRSPEPLIQSRNASLI
jgi:hypothetical protein